MRPLAIDPFCGLGGWTEGLLAEGYDVVGFDNERHEYGDHRYPAQLVVQDVLTLHGSQFRNAALIVASPPCQAYSYRAMPWKRAKALPPPDNSLFEACFRIQAEASAAAGRTVPLIVENVRGAQKWIGRARWNFGSFYLWGDVPALMPTIRPAAKVPGLDWNGFKNGDPNYKGQAFNPAAQGKAFREELERKNGLKMPSAGGRRTDVGNGVRFTSRDCGIEGVKQSGISGTRANGKGDRWFQDGAASHGSRSRSRKAASAMIAKIPLPLSRHIGKVFHP